MSFVFVTLDEFLCSDFAVAVPGYNYFNHNKDTVFTPFRAPIVYTG